MRNQSSPSMGMALIWLGVAVGAFVLLVWLGPPLGKIFDACIADDSGHVDDNCADWNRVKGAKCPSSLITTAAFAPGIALMALGGVLRRRGPRPSTPAARVWAAITGLAALCTLISMALSAICPYAAWRVIGALLLLLLVFVLTALLALGGVALGIRRVLPRPPSPL